MTLLQWEDFAGDDPPKDAVWVESTVRFLVPRAGLHSTDLLDSVHAWTIDTLSHAQAGEPAQCECGLVAIRYGDLYPWGRRIYGRRDATHRVRGQYCPHCDGGEDVG